MSFPNVFVGNLELEDSMLEIKDLKAGIEGKEILKGINLNVNAGEVHAITLQA